MNNRYNTSNYNNRHNVNQMRNEFFKDLHINKQPNSQFVLKRSSFINYDDTIPYVDDNVNVNDNKFNILVSYRNNQSNEFSHSPYSPIFKTSSISSLKTSALSENWPSSEYKERFRAVSQSDGYDSQNDQLSYHKNNYRIDQNYPNSNSFISNTSSVDSSSNFQSVTNSQKFDDVNNLKISTDDSSSIGEQGTPEEMISRLSFAGMKLLDALRLFARFVPLVGESQQRERLLKQFTEKYQQDNPQSFSNNFDKCYALVVAIMILNTDRHSPNNPVKMSCSKFVSLLMDNYFDYEYNAEELEDIYNSINRNQLKMGKALVNHMLSQQQQNQGGLIRSGTKIFAKKFTQFIRRSSRDNLNDHTISVYDALYQCYLCGNLKRRYILEENGKKPPLFRSGFKTQLIVCRRLKLVCYCFRESQYQTSISKISYSRDCEVVSSPSSMSVQVTFKNGVKQQLQVGRLLDSEGQCVINLPKSLCVPLASAEEQVQLSCEYSLHHAYAYASSSSSVGRKSREFLVRFTDKSEILFQLSDADKSAVDWVDTINYVAALYSAPAIAGYGSSDYYKPLLPSNLTTLDKEGQLLHHQDQLKNLNASYHSIIQNKSFDESSVSYLKYEMERYEAYIDVLTRLDLDVDNLFIPIHYNSNGSNSISSSNVSLHHSNSNNSNSTLIRRNNSRQSLFSRNHKSQPVFSPTNQKISSSADQSTKRQADSCSVQLAPAFSLFTDRPMVGSPTSTASTPRIMKSLVPSSPPPLSARISNLNIGLPPRPSPSFIPRDQLPNYSPPSLHNISHSRTNSYHAHK